MDDTLKGWMLRMDRKRRGLILAACGILLLVLSFAVLLNFADLYLPSLIIMFVAVVLIGIGTALAKGFDATIEVPRETCYYCNGTGKIGTEDEPETCPRCGGTGLARSDD
ncbi:MAG: hypothetical protein ACE5IO_09760 [Thermoplasmata archaeon]